MITIISNFSCINKISVISHLPILKILLGCRLLNTKKTIGLNTNKKLVHYKVLKEFIDTSSSQIIPPEKTLEKWEKDIHSANNLTTDIFYYESNLERYNKKSIETALKIHKTKAVSKTVEKELDWFSRNRLLPKHVTKIPNIINVNHFK